MSVKVLYSNVFGELYNDSIFLKEKQLEIKLNYIKSFRFFEVVDKETKNALYVLSLVFFMIFVVMNNKFFVLFSIAFFLISSFYRPKKHYLEIETSNINDVYVCVFNKNNMNDVKAFVYEVKNFINKTN